MWCGHPTQVKPSLPYPPDWLLVALARWSLYQGHHFLLKMVDAWKKSLYPSGLTAEVVACTGFPVL
jgi:hypothetical protein